MYIYLSSLVKIKNSPSPWKNIDIGNMTFKDIIQQYSNVYFVFEHSILPGQHYCFLNDLLSFSVNTDLTLLQQLNQWDNLALPTTTAPRTLMSRSATYADALQTDWSFQTMRPGTSPESEAIGSQKTDLFLYKDGVSPEIAGRSLVCMVNGLAHITAAGYGGLVVTGGGRVIRQTESNLVSFLNLGHLGEIEYKMLDRDSLHPGTSSMQNETMDGYLSLNTDLTGKSVIVSIAGMLFFEGEVIQVINRETGYIKFNYHRIDHGSLFYEMAVHMRPTELGTIMDNIRAGILLKSSIYDPENLKAILDLDQSFAIVVDADNVVYEYQAVQDGFLKNVLVSTQLPNKPIRGFSNRFLPYKFKDEKGKFSIHVDDYRIPVFLHWTTNQFATKDYISFGVKRSLEDLSSASVFVDIKTQWFETAVE